VSATVDASKAGEPITKYIYGQFIEHTRDLINRSIWAEMLDDRKFFYDVDSKPEDSASPRDPALPTRPAAKRNHWRPIGPDSAVTMDREHPYTGDQTPVIKLDGAEPRGIGQAGLALRKGRGYTGRVVLAGDPGVKVTVSLVWGPNPGDRQTVAASKLGAAYAKVPVKFTAGGDTADGRIEIAATGKGTFRVGATSLMRADNVKGFRTDTTGLLKQLNSGFYRLPGGNFLSNHDWQDAIGDIDQRPPTWDYNWRFLQPNDVGTDELMTLCDLLGVEPYITVNAGFGEARSAANLVEYANGSVDTPFGKLRAANGHPAPYKVKYWNIGNEPYGAWQLGHIPINQYVIKHNMFAKAMRKKDPTITLLASGAMVDEMTMSGAARLSTGKIVVDIGSEFDWTGGLLANSWGNFDGLTEHWYVYEGQRFDLETAQNAKPGQRGYLPVEESMLDRARRGANRVRDKAEAWEEYVKRFPAINDKKIFVSIDEWSGDHASGLKQNLLVAYVFHEMFRHTEFIKMSAQTMGMSCIDYDANDAQLNSRGLLFKMYRDHFGTVPVEVTGNSPQPAPKWPVGGEQPKVNAGSPTFPLDVSAAWSSDHKFLTVAIVNATESAQALDLSFKGVNLSGKARMWRMAGPDVNGVDTLGKKPAVEIAEVSVNAPGNLTFPPASIQILELEAK